jgi:hypothetical protein
MHVAWMAGMTECVCVCARVACADRRVLDPQCPWQSESPKTPFRLLVIVFFPFVVGFKIHAFTHVHTPTGQNQ